MTSPTRFLQFFLKIYAQEFIHMAYRGILQREPDALGLAAYTKELQATKDLKGLLRDLTISDEHWEYMLQERASELVGAVYQALLGREPDTKGLAVYTKNLCSTEGFTRLLRQFVRSEEFNKAYRQTRKWPHPSLTYTKKTIVFIHIQKTGGTSLQNMLIEAYGRKEVFGDHVDALYQYSPSELSCYSVFQGHFNFDSLAYIPRQKLSTCTFFRDPKKRLYSLYHFWRAHEPSSPHFPVEFVRANQHLIVPFFQEQQHLYSPATWNHMTWAIMGARQWQAWRQILRTAKTKDEANELISTTMAPAIRRRIQDFACIGLLEHYDASVTRLFRFLGKEPPKKIRTDHSLEKLTKTNPHFKKNMAKQPITTELDTLLDSLTQLDTIVYQEAVQIFHSQQDNTHLSELTTH